jgi:hypothetical protein
MSVAVWTGVGQFVRGIGAAGDILGKGLIHGVVGGALSLAQGGSFLQGFATSSVGAGTGLFSNSIRRGDVFLDTAIVGAAGGRASMLTGGIFAAGFITAAFANLYNKWEGWGAFRDRLGDAAAITAEWVTGLGPDHRDFGPGTQQAADMQDAPGILRALRDWYAAN